MQFTVKKNIITRSAAVILAAFFVALMVAFSNISSANAADVEVLPVAADTYETFTVDGVEFTAMPMDAPPIYDFEVVKLADEDDDDSSGGGTPSGSGSAKADSAYTKVVNFFVTWLRRVGALVALVGAIMFGLAIKNNDADQKQNGLLTMVAGFVVFAICLATDMFDLFS